MPLKCQLHKHFVHLGKACFLEADIKAYQINVILMTGGLNSFSACKFMRMNLDKWWFIYQWIKEKYFSCSMYLIYIRKNDTYNKFLLFSFDKYWYFFLWLYVECSLVWYLNYWCLKFSNVVKREFKKHSSLYWKYWKFTNRPYMRKILHVSVQVDILYLRIFL